MSKYESPDYEVILKDEDFEIRNYNSFSIVEYENIKDLNSDNGFKSLFNYISGENEDKEKIKMTVPVLRKESSEMDKIAFVVPEKFESHIPSPTNPALKVNNFKEGLFGTIQYSGYSNESKESEMKSKLEKWISNKDYETNSNYIFASYDPPFKPLFRKNEI